MPAGTLICLIDDDASLRKALAQLLASMGYDCRSHDSAESALQCGDAERAACILTDIHMPGMDAFAFKRELDLRGAPVPVIMMTARAEEHLERRALETGAICFLRKPLRADSLADCIALALV